MLVFYILWYRAFKNGGYRFTCSTLLLYMLFQAIAVAVGVFLYEMVGDDVELIMTSFVILPIVVVSFSSFFGIWVSNDFNGYEKDFLQGKAFRPDQIEAYNKLSCFGKMKGGAWRPSTRKDWVFFSMILINMISIITYLIATVAMFKPAYVGISIALLILVFELAFINVWKYRATNFSMQASVVVPMLLSVFLMIIWLVYMVFEVLMDEDETDIVRGGVVVIGIAYFMILVGNLLYLEYRSANHDIGRLSASFWILFGFAWLVLLAVGAYALTFTHQGLFGIVWISVCIYILLNLLLYRFRKIIGAIYSFCFIVAGIFLLLTSDDNDQSFQGISVLYFGMFILSFGSFIHAYF